MKNLLTILLLFSVHIMNGQSGSIQGTITDEDSELLMFANIILEKNDVIVCQTQTDIDGNYAFHHLEAGTYEMFVYYVGINPKKYIDIKVLENEIQTLDVNTNTHFCDDYPIRIKHQPKNNPWNFTQGTTFSSDEIQRSSYKN